MGRQNAITQLEFNKGNTLAFSRAHVHVHTHTVSSFLMSFERGTPGNTVPHSNMLGHWLKTDKKINEGVLRFPFTSTSSFLRELQLKS